MTKPIHVYLTAYLLAMLKDFAAHPAWERREFIRKNLVLWEREYGAETANTVRLAINEARAKSRKAVPA